MSTTVGLTSRDYCYITPLGVASQLGFERGGGCLNGLRYTVQFNIIVLSINMILPSVILSSPTLCFGNKRVKKILQKTNYS
jgi:hypothetical protein